jgi:DNA-binding NtrC family response regulator
MDTHERKISLLIVDDEEKYLESISKRLGLRDFDVTTAVNGKDAIKAAKRGGFDVALVDLRMPDLDGTEVLKTLKAKHKYLEVIILTAFGTIDSAVECTKLGAFGYLEKPYDLDALVGVIKSAYESRLRTKFEHDEKRKRELDVLAMGSSPMAVLRSLVRLDDDEK